MFMFVCILQSAAAVSHSITTKLLSAVGEGTVQMRRQM